MIKNREIIQSVPLEKKLEMIADGNSLGNAETGGIPRVNPASFEGVNSACGEIYPEYSFLANSWNNELISSVTGDLVLRAKAQGVNLLFTPEAKTKSNPYTAGISEDTFYGGTVIFNVVKAAKSAGVTPCVTGCALTDCDADYLDVFPDSRAVHEYLFGFTDLFAGAYGNVFMTAFTRLSGKYEKINCGEVSACLHAAAGDSGYVICSQTDKDLAVESVTAGNTFSYSSDLGALKAATENYAEIKRLQERGEATPEDLEAACRSGNAVSGEAIDGAADKIVDFALYCNIGANEQVDKTYDTEALSLQAAEESIVLLKNDGVLPFNGAEKVCVIGQPAFIPNPATRESFLDVISKSRITVAGSAQGYTLSDERCDELLQEAVSLAKNCGTVLLFLGLDGQKEQELCVNRRLKLPANRLALIGALKDTGAKIIAVITTPASIDVSFDSEVSALLTAPLSCMRGGEALINILAGKSPCGKLANTLYADTDEYFEKIKRDKDCGRIRIGFFSGYRRYTTAGIPVKYPFGHGLSYTQFTYSDLNVQGEQVLVTVRNTGGRDGSEVVQLYAGKPDSKIIRPARELKSFVKVYLRAGEAKTLRFRLSPGRLAVYCKDCGKKLTEGGSYIIYVGSSVNDIRLSGTMYVSGTALKPDNAKYSDYIPTVSNVVEGGYTLAPVKKVAPNGKKLKYAGLIVMLAAALGGVILGILHLVNVTSVSYDTGATVALVLLSQTFIIGSVILGVGFILIKSAKANAVEVCTSKPEAVKAEGGDSLDSLFEQEFGEEEEEREQVKEPDSDEQEILKYLDGSLDFAAAAENLRVYFTERGLAVNIQTARKILSAFSAGRLILLKSANDTHLFLKLLCGFFGAESAVENYVKCGGVEEFLNLGNGGILNTLTGAENKKHCVQPVCVERVDIGDIGAFLLPFAKYMKNPEGGASLCIENGKQVKLPQNIWFVFSLSEDSHLNAADIYTSEIACVLDPDFAAAQVREDKTQFTTLSYYQLKKISDAAKKAYTLDEDGCWKKVDKFEKYISSHTPFAIDNKVWQRLERFVSAYLACGGEQYDALDSVAAAKLMVMACANLNGKLKPSDGTILSEVENIFGDEHISGIKNILKYSGMPSGRRTGNAGR